MRTLLTLVLTFLTLAAPTANALQVGDKAPNWILEAAEGGPIAYYQNSENQYSVLFFWATWCPYCQALMPEMTKLQHTLKNKPVNFYGLNLWEDADPEAYLREKGLSMKLLLGAENVADRYGVKGTPGVFLVAPNHEILYMRKAGEEPQEVTEAIITQLKKHEALAQ